MHTSQPHNTWVSCGKNTWKNTRKTRRQTTAVALASSCQPYRAVLRHVVGRCTSGSRTPAYAHAAGHLAMRMDLRRGTNAGRSVQRTPAQPNERQPLETQQCTHCCSDNQSCFQQWAAYTSCRNTCGSCTSSPLLPLHSQTTLSSWIPMHKNTAFLECGIQISYNLSIYVLLKRHPTLVAPIFLRREGL